MVSSSSAEDAVHYQQTSRTLYVFIASKRLLTEAAALQVYAVDKSPEAIAWAQLNVQRLSQQHRVQVTYSSHSQYTRGVQNQLTSRDCLCITMVQLTVPAERCTICKLGRCQYKDCNKTEWTLIFGHTDKSERTPVL